jgi:Cu-Zn family superoxide dismutase
MVHSDRTREDDMNRTCSRQPRVAAASFAACLAVALAACATTESDGPRAVAELKPASGSSVRGVASFRQEGDHVVVRVKASGLAPSREHGFHVHEKGDCSSPDASSAGEHLNPTDKPHGPPGSEHHAGDLPSLKADAAGNVTANFEVKGALLGTGAPDLMGKALVIHADPDDYITQPAGNTGIRVACGVIASPAVPAGIGEPAKTIPKEM